MADFVLATPTKQFFVSMLTRDIELKDAVLDLLDNCVDGVVRSISKNLQETDTHPYKGYWAKITFSGFSFLIEDNCGGISREMAEYAFRMGRPSNAKYQNLRTVGVYGIGMKRAIFKMGRGATVTTKHKREAYKVTISSEWLGSDDEWKLPLKEERSPLDHSGTRIEITNLHPAVRRQFESDIYVTDFIEEVATHYAVIIEKGFAVYINKKQVKPKPSTLRLDVDYASKDEALAPYIYFGIRDGVQFRLAVGIFDEMPPEDADEEESSEQRRSREDSGWTVVCNDRVVLYKDKTRLTGWGEANVPSFHPQFISISGVVEFTSDDPSKLPVTTTKRGVNSNSDLYLEVKNYMREGTKLFTNYTNRWKNDRKGEKRLVSSASVKEVRKLFNSFPRKQLERTRTPGDVRFIPALPLPEDARSHRTHRWIRFSRPIREIAILSEYLFGNVEAEPSDVGDECFKRVLKDARK